MSHSQAGEALVDAMTPPPPADPAPKQLARAIRSCASLVEVNLSGTALPVRHCRGADLDMCGKRLYDHDAVLLAELLQYNAGLRNLALSRCRMTEIATRTVVSTLRFSQPISLTEIRLADNRLRVTGAHVLLDALEQTGCAQLRVLDLSSTELCGGIMTEDCAFGAIRGAAARIAADGQVCRYVAG